jgi:hypothetical protein
MNEKGSGLTSMALVANPTHFVMAGLVPIHAAPHVP